MKPILKTVNCNTSCKNKKICFRAPIQTPLIYVQKNKGEKVNTILSKALQTCWLELMGDDRCAVFQSHFLPAFPKERMKLLQKNPSQH